jgi:hypothetical protein
LPQQILCVGYFLGGVDFFTLSVMRFCRGFATGSFLSHQSGGHQTESGSRLPIPLLQEVQAHFHFVELAVSYLVQHDEAAVVLIALRV